MEEGSMPMPDQIDPEDSELASLAAEVRDWLTENWRREGPLQDWLYLVVDAGWAAPSWPESRYGRGVSRSASQVIAREFSRVGAPGSGQDLFNIPGNTILRYGSDELQRAFLRPLLTAEVEWCLLYSEPGAGSDLAAVQTRADWNGDGWVINGQKVWTTGAAQADYGLLLARTAWDVPKHSGLTFFWLPMKQPGVEVRPIRQITGGSQFNEVFFTDARAGDDAVLGTVNDGWRVVRTVLAYERAVMAGPRSAAGHGTAQRDDAPKGHGPAERLDSRLLAKQLGKEGDPVVRQELARLHCLRLVNRWNSLRANAASWRGDISPVASIGKLATSRLAHATARANSWILGTPALLVGADFPLADAVNHSALAAFMLSIGGGTDQIQRDLIAEQLLGLPREPEVDRDLPFSEVRKSAPMRSFG
jgi:alkylation response protein AidB-like acyl-CoA dehydrogenase